MAAEQPASRDEWEAVLAAAKREGRVAVYGPAGDALRDAMVSGFRRAYPDVTIDWSGARGAEIIAKVSGQRRAHLSTIDGVLSAIDVLPQLRAIDAVAPVKPTLILPQATDRSQWLDGRIEYSDSEADCNPTFVSEVGRLFACNPDLAKPEELDELSDLLDPK